MGPNPGPRRTQGGRVRFRRMSIAILDCSSSPYEPNEPHELLILLVTYLFDPLLDEDPERGWEAVSPVFDEHLCVLPPEVVHDWNRRVAEEVRRVPETSDAEASETVYALASEVLSRCVECGADEAWTVALLEAMTEVYRSRPLGACIALKKLREHWVPKVQDTELTWRPTWTAGAPRVIC